LLALVYWACVRRYLPYDGDIMFRVTKSLVTAHSLRIQDPVLHLNQPYSYYGLAVSLLLIPFFLLGQALFGDGTVLITTFDPMVTALTVVLLLSLLVELGISWRRAFVVGLLYGFGSLAWAYSGVLYSEPLVGLCTVAGLLYVRRYEREKRWSLLLTAGSVAALGLLARWDSALLVVAPVTAYVGYAILRPPPRTPQTLASHVPRGSRGPAGPPSPVDGGGTFESVARSTRSKFASLALFAAPIAFVTAINLGYDLFRYGRSLASPYLGTFQFSTPLPVGVFGLLFSPGAGLIVYVPLVLLGCFGARALFQRWPRLTLLIAGMVAVRLAFYGMWFGWDGGITFGPRFLVPILPLLFVPIGFALQPPTLTLPRKGGGKILALAIALSSLSVGVELVNQLVPYGQYYVSVAAGLDAAARHACPGCPLWQLVQLTTGQLDYAWQYLPLHGQLRMLLAGDIDPIWRHIAIAVPFLLAPLALIGYLLYRLAGRLDDAPAPTLNLRGKREREGTIDLRPVA
jgi:hypothetical protein